MPSIHTTHSPELGARIRVRPGRRPEREQDGVWRTLTNRELLELPIDGATWQWLRAQGVRRPPPSGPRRREMPESERARKQRLLRLTDEEWHDVTTVAERWEVSRSDAVARMARETLRRTR